MAFWTDEADKGGAWRPAAGGKWLTLPPPPLPEWWWAAKCCWRDVSMSWRLTLWSRSRSSTVVVEAAGDAAVGASGRHSTAAIRTKHKDNGTTNQFIIFVWIPSAIKRDEIRERERATTCARAEAEGRTEGGYAAVAGAKSWGGPGSVSATRREDCLPGFVNRLWEEVACFRFVSLSLSFLALRVCVCVRLECRSWAQRFSCFSWVGGGIGWERGNRRRWRRRRKEGCSNAFYTEAGKEWMERLALIFFFLFWKIWFQVRNIQSVWPNGVVSIIVWWQNRLQLTGVFWFCRLLRLTSW